MRIVLRPAGRPAALCTCRAMNSDPVRLHVHVRTYVHSLLLFRTRPSFVSQKMEENGDVEGVKLHTKGRVMKSPVLRSEDDVFYFQGPAGRATGIVKFLEPLSPLLNYFEYVIVNKGAETAIGVGCGDRAYPMSRMPGWNRNSCGYHADDGKLYHESGMGREFGPRCTTGDRMGCGVNFNSALDRGTVEIFFTKNGQQVGEVERMKRPLNGIYPLIGLHSPGEKIRYLGHWRRAADGATEPMEEDESPEGRWLRCNGVRFVDNDLVLEYAGMGGDVQDVGIAQSRYPLNRTRHYFELEIVEEGSLGACAIGLGKTTYPLHRHPGWNAGGVGYHADDGKVFKGRGHGDPFGPRCTAGDRMGCGILFPVQTEREEEAAVESEESDMETGTEERSLLPARFSPLHFSDSDEGSDYNSDESEESYSGDSLVGELLRPQLRMAQAEQRIFGGRGRPFNQALRNIAPWPPLLPQLPNKRPRSAGNNGRTCTVYFTKNGERVGEVECDVPKGGFYPVVAMLSHGEKIRVNFDPLSG